jgi:fructokinase
MQAKNLFRLGIDLGGTKLESALLDEQNQLVWRERLPTPAGDYRATLTALAASVQRARTQMSSLAPKGEMTVGIGTPGTQMADGRMKNCNSTCLNGQKLQADLEDALGQAVRLANDANCLALSEATDGAGAGAPVVFAAILGTGTGAGIAVHGRVLSGPNGLAGEWGHNPLPWRQPNQDPDFSCYCGQRQCIESLVSGPGLARDHALQNGGCIAAAEIHQLALAGDAACALTLDRHANRLARALAGVINLLDPDVIVLGGGLSRMPHLYEQVPQLWSQWVFAAGSAQAVRTRLLPSLHGDASGVRGAAWLWRDGVGA